MKRVELSLLLALLSGCRTVPIAPVPAPISAPSTPLPATPVVQPAAVEPPSPGLGKAPALWRLPDNQIPDFIDDTSTASLSSAISRSAGYYHGLNPNEVFHLAQDTYTASEIADSLDYFSALIGTREWRDKVKHEFNVYQSIGKDDAHTVTFSSYYEPTLSARLKRSPEFRYPIYGRPNDLIDVDLGLFDPAWQGGRIAGRRQGPRLVPYYTREDIDSLGALKGQGIEIAWAKDPLDVFFLQIEGSGWLDLGDGETRRIRFDGHNGRKFGSVGQYLIQSGRVPKEGFNHHSFILYMHDHAEERQKLLNINPRYVFFRLDTSTAAAYAYGNIDVALTPGRSVATDPKLFPKGLLAWVDIHGNAGPIQRFVMNQDEGGAIQGPARVDFFAGHGTEAETFAFQLWNPGKLYFLVRKKP